MEPLPLLLPGYIAAKLPITSHAALGLGMPIACRPGTARRDKLAIAALLLFAATLLSILARASGCAGVRHALTVPSPLKTRMEINLNVVFSNVRNEGQVTFSQPKVFRGAPNAVS
jgi:hypothetical protein